MLVSLTLVNTHPQLASVSKLYEFYWWSQTSTCKEKCLISVADKAEFARLVSL